MTRSRSTRTLASLGISLALALTALAAPTAVLAAPAPLTIGYGPNPAADPPATTGAVPTAVSPGAHAAFQIWARNDGTSNIPKLFLTGLTDGEFHSVAVTYAGTALAGGCAEGPEDGAELQCSWEQVVPGATIMITVVFMTPTLGQSMPVDFEWSTVGYVEETKGKNKSRGDAFQQMDSVALNGNDDVFAGGYIVPDGSTVVTTNITLNRRNPQYTSVNAPASNIGVTVGEEDPDPLAACPGVAASSCFGQLSAISVASGQAFPGGFTVEIGYNANKPNVNFVHFFDEGVVHPVTGFPYEFITETCNSTTAPTNLPCKIVETSQGKTFATLWLTQNGKIQGF